MATEIRKISFDGPILTAGGNWEGEFNEYGDILQILIAPTTPDNTYSFGILDEDGYVIYAEYDLTGHYFKLLRLPLFPGIKRFVLEGVTRDELFRVKLIYKL